MRALVDERPDGDPDTLYERASVHDYLAKEHDAVPLYCAALRGGLTGPRQPQCIVQLASSLRNTGEPEAAIELLENLPSDGVHRLNEDRVWLSPILRFASTG